jgi:hypothetical protein
VSSLEGIAKNGTMRLWHRREASRPAPRQTAIIASQNDGYVDGFEVIPSRYIHPKMMQSARSVNGPGAAPIGFLHQWSQDALIPR